MQAPLQTKPNYTNVMRYCPRLVMTRRSMDHSGENRIQKTQCIPSRCLTTAPLPFCVIRAELDEAAAPVDWTFLYCNDALAALEGYPKDKLLGQRFFQLFPDGDRKWLKPYYEAAYEKRAAAFDSISEEIGQYLHIDCIPLDEPGLCACLLRNTRQESEYRQRLDEELHATLRTTEEINRVLQANTDFLRRTERYNRTLLGRASCGIVSYTLPERKNLYMNAEALRVYGIDSLEDGQAHLHELMANSVYNSSVTLRRLKALRTQDGTVDFECVINNRKGLSASLVVHTEVVTSPQGERMAYTPFMDALENKSLRNEKEILNALCKDFVTVLQCDLQSDSAVRLNIDPAQPSPRAEDVYRLLQTDNSYSATLETYFDLFVDPEVSVDFHQKTNAVFLMDYLPKHNDRFSYRYQLKPNPPGVKHMEVQISHFNSTEDF